MDVNELIKSGVWKYLETPKWTFKDIIVSNQGIFYNISNRKVYNYCFYNKSPYPHIRIRNNNNEIRVNVPYVICTLFRNDYIKHNKKEINKYVFLDGNVNNCSVKNIRANFYDYKIVKNEDGNKAWIDIKGY